MEYFRKDLDGQQKDVENINKRVNLCYSGDFNMSFSSDYYKEGYPKTEAQKMNRFFKENNLINKTKENNNCVIHIVLSENFIKDLKVKSKMMQIEKNISDHNLVILEIENK
jgi:hypothetical protein